MDNKDSQETIIPSSQPPDLSDEVKERARLRPIELGQTPSQEMQDAFERYIKLDQREDSEDEVRIDAEKLFCAFETPHVISREYYAPYDGEFGSYREAQFSKTHNNAPVLIRQHSEDLSEYTTVWFNDFRGEFGEGFLLKHGELRIDAKINGRGMSINYDKDGQVYNFGFSKRFSVPLHIGLGREDLEELFEKGELDPDQEGTDTYYCFFNKKTGFVEFRRETDGELKDVIKFPIERNRKAIMDELLPSPHFDNPLNTDPTEDDSWRVVDLFEKVGVSWERY